MHQTRSQVLKKIPIPRKGTKYVARAISHRGDSVPVVVAVRDLLKLAKTSKEVKQMIQLKLIKINGKEVKDLKESVKLFNVFEAKNQYILTLTSNGRFNFEENKEKERLCKVINKKLLKDNKIQINLHDGSNILTKEKINVHDSVYLDFSGKIKKHIPIGRDNNLIVISGKYIGRRGKVKEMDNGKLQVRLDEKDEMVQLEKRRIVVL